MPIDIQWIACNNPNEVYHYDNNQDYVNEFNLDGIIYPVGLDQIPQFEDQNNISCNIYGYDNTIYPLYLSANPKDEHVNLMYYHHHYSLIRSLDRLLSSYNRHRGRSYFCDRCLVPQWSDERLTDHKLRCKTDNPMKITMSKDQWLQFSNYRRQLLAPYVIIADFEALTVKIQHCKPSLQGSSTTKTQLHTPASFGLYDIKGCGCDKEDGDPVNPKDVSEEPVIYRDTDAIKRFLQTVINRAMAHQEVLNDPRPLNMSPAQQQHYNNNNQCHICREDIDINKDDKHADHCHWCGRYRGPSHGRCNIKYRMTRDVTVVMHNLRGYDGHFIMQEVGKVCNEKKMNIAIIPKGLEDYLGFNIYFKGRKRRLFPARRHNTDDDNEDNNNIFNTQDDDDDDDHSMTTNTQLILPGGFINRDALPSASYDMGFWGQAAGHQVEDDEDIRFLLGDEDEDGFIGDGDDEDGLTRGGRGGGDNDDGDGRQCSSGWRIRFIDSIQFLKASMEELVECTDKSTSTEAPLGSFQHTRSHFPRHLVDLMLRKGVYPYDYMDQWERFNDTRLPPIEDFYSKLTETPCEDDDYNHAIQVWNRFNCNTMGDYHDLYLKSDVLLLADIIANFRTTGLKHYGLDPVHYYTLPGYAWDCFLRYSGVKMELLKDQEMYVFLESGIRGGVSMISHRKATANNKYADSDYTPHDPTKPTVFIADLDGNNLYGYAMLQKLPLKDFRWVNLDTEVILPYIQDADGDKGMILEVDLDYPQELHDAHNDFPLAPETIEITEDMLSPYAKELKKKLGLKGGKDKKLVPNLGPKRHYILHFKTLQLYLRLGMKLKMIHRALEFTQSAYMATYINLNTRLRTQATNDPDKNLFKLMNNAVFGKTMENVRNYKNVKLVTTRGAFNRLSRHPRYIRRSVFTEDLIAVHSHKVEVCLNKTIYGGVVILELARNLMYEFLYDYLRPKYGLNAQILFHDTDSYGIAIQTEDFYRDMREDAHMYDTSNYPADHPNYSLVNKKVVGKMKDEMGGKPIEEAILLRAKMYSIKQAENETKRAKGVKKYVVSKFLKHANYKRVLEESTMMRSEMHMFRNERHVINTITQVKSSICALDTKRYLREDGISSYAYYNYHIDEINQANTPSDDDNNTDNANITDDDNQPSTSDTQIWRPW